LKVSSGARTGAVTLIQRFGSALNLNPHPHMLFLDGASTFRGRGRRQPEDRFWLILELLIGNIRGKYCSALRTKAAVG
jgi:hypothetical protein